MHPLRLSNFPYIKLRLTCSLCPRRGEYRLARLAAKFGPEMLVAEVIWKLSQDCPHQNSDWRRKPRKYEARCGARLEDINLERQPPDDAPQARRDGLSVIDGGKA